jgi:hypothetical protein
MIYVTRKSTVSGIERTKCLDIKESQLKEYEEGSSRFIQDIFPNLSASEREFIMTGISDEEWEEVFGGDW